MGTRINKGIKESMKSVSYLKWVSELPCIICANESQAHHLRVLALGSGMGKKCPDYFTLPVCYAHHAECHDGTISKEDQMRWCLQTIDKAFKDGIISCKL